jgi:hypothetical protein
MRLFLYPVLAVALLPLLHPQLPPIDPIDVLLLLFLDLLVLLSLDNDLLGSDDLLHLLVEALIVKEFRLLITLLLLEAVKLVDVRDQRRYDILSLHVLAKQPTRADLLSAGRTFFLHFAIVVLYAMAAELVKALPHIQRVLVHIKTYWT